MQPAETIGSKPHAIIRTGPPRPPAPYPVLVVRGGTPRDWSWGVTYITSFLIFLVLLIPSKRRELGVASTPVMFDSAAEIEGESTELSKHLKTTKLRLDYLEQIEAELNRKMARGKGAANGAQSYRTQLSSKPVTSTPGQIRTVRFSQKERVARPSSEPAAAAAAIITRKHVPLEELKPSPEELERRIEPVPGSRQGELQQVIRVINKHSRRRNGAPRLASIIVHEARRAGIDPLFVAAVIKTESAFNPVAKSHKGALGLMQIMPGTSTFIQGFEQFKNEPRGQLTDEAFNIRQGVAYLRYLMERYHGNQLLSLMAYNWGPGHLEKAMNGRFSVPPEVLKYATRILDDNKRWRTTMAAETTT